MKKPFLELKYLTIIAGIILFQSVDIALGQIPPARPAELNAALDSLFTSGNFTELEIEALRLLREDHEDKNIKMAAHIYLGFVEVLTGRNDAAKNDFQKAISINPGIRLDPVFVPPKIHEVFQEVLEEYKATKEDQDKINESINSYLEFSDEELRKKTSSTILNLAVPGSGFILEGRPVRGSFWTVIQGAAVSGFIYSFTVTSEKRDEYYQVSRNENESDFNTAYDTYNKWYKRTWYWGIGCASIYLASQIDFHLQTSNVVLQPAILKDDQGIIPGVGVKFSIK